MTAPATPASVDNLDVVDSPAEAAAHWAEWRAAMLERLAACGLRLAEELAARALNSPSHSRLRRDPAEAYARVSRAVWLTLADAQLVALRKGEPDPPRSARQDPPPNNEGDPALRVIRRRARDAVADAIDLAIRDRAEARRALHRLYENLIEHGRYDRLLGLPFRECVAAICADLGVDPDWSRWSDETDFARSIYHLPRPIGSRWGSRLDEDGARRRKPPAEPKVELDP